MTQNPPQPWERQKGERSKAFKLFTLYRDLGPIRSVEKVRELWEQEYNQELSRAMVERYCTNNNWVSRAEAYDDHLDSLGLQEREDDILDMNKRQGDAYKDFQDEIQKIMQKEKSADTLSPNKLNDLTRAFERAAKGERLAKGEVTDRQESNGVKRVKISGKLDKPEIRAGLTELISKMSGEGWGGD